ncbi:hypothetical protein [Prosthecodimorpha staleyi]|uniref:Uncharacterized protein n=1 Tax=Prosthecodimorpha staleyi TaxID=2840188 RepID=A0A947D6A4_9HYPH|nr:hypothetical protein [Prosthecodimorpha staleyi]MBT9288987.1 hypothetical protein [Prosthecodimorpha staleyi]
MRDSASDYPNDRNRFNIQSRQPDLFGRSGNLSSGTTGDDMKIPFIATAMAGFLVGFACEPSDAHFSAVFGPLKAVLTSAEPTPSAAGGPLCRMEAIDRAAVRMDEIVRLQPVD